MNETVDENEPGGHTKQLRPGLLLLEDIPGTGEMVQRHHRYRIRLRLWLSGGEAVRWPVAWGPVGAARLDDAGTTLLTEVRVDRRTLFNGLFYGMHGMHVGGMRQLDVAPHLAYAGRGVPGIIPANARLRVEVTVLEAVP